MIIQSEITGKTYKTVDACIEDERKYLKEKEEAEAKEKEAKEKIDSAFKEAKTAWKKYIDTFKEAGFKVTSADELLLMMEFVRK